MPNETVELESRELQEGEVSLELLPSEEDVDGAQHGYHEFYTHAGVDILAVNSIGMLSADSLHILSGTFVIQLVQAVVPAVGTAVAGWFAGRSGRKVRVKVGDIEIEARTCEEVTQLLQQVAAIQAGQPLAKPDHA